MFLFRWERLGAGTVSAIRLAVSVELLSAIYTNRNLPDAVAIQLEQRYKGIRYVLLHTSFFFFRSDLHYRAPHKIKGGVSGCVRECAEAQSKDFGLIASDKGWNSTNSANSTLSMLLLTYSTVFLAGNGGANPRHATLFATDVPPSKVVRILDRFLMLYIRTADKLMRTARWIEQFEGGIEVRVVTMIFHSALLIMWLQKLKKVILEDELGICADLDRDMDALVGTYSCEWTEVVNDPERRKQFRQFVNAVSNIPCPRVSQARPAQIGRSGGSNRTYC